jgi:hypothetical protein
MLTVKASMFLFQWIILSETCCGKNAEAAENGHTFHFWGIFQHCLTHYNSELHMQHTKPLQSKPEPAVRMCAFQHSSLHCFGSCSIDELYHVQTKGVP